MLLSIIVIFHNMRREMPRTLHTLSRRYQRDIADLQYEVLVIDNSSTEPLSPNDVCSYGPQFRYHFFRTSSPSPVEAVNWGFSQVAGDVVAVMIDGAHMLSPGVLSGIQRASRISANPFVATLAMHLGPERQYRSMLRGYNQQQEDHLLASVNWQQDGYELFRVVQTPADSSRGWFGCLFESNCFALRRDAFAKLGGFDPGFTSAGGGMVNLDFFRRAVESPELDYMMLLGEATFHQFHGGFTTNRPLEEHPVAAMNEEYIRVRGLPYERSGRRPFFLGSLSPQVLSLTKISASFGLDWWIQGGGATK